jgi:AGCS family alanine or glycine:cation symporter
MYFKKRRLIDNIERLSSIKKVSILVIIVFFLITSLPFAVMAEQKEKKSNLLAQTNKVMFSMLFFDVAFGSIKVKEVDRDGNPVFDENRIQKEKTVSIPFLIVVLAFGAIFFTFWYGWINLRLFKHSIDVIKGKYDRPEDQGEISHFRALTSALSATVGLGNIAGVAVAIQTGGPGAVFWMIFIAIFGMSAKFSSCTLSQLYRQVNPDGTISGGPMYYLDIGLREKGGFWRPFGKVLAFMFAFMVMGGAIGGGNMFQANQAVEAFISTFSLAENAKWWLGITLSVFVGAVILGGIKRIGLATSRIVPSMFGIYVITSIFIILVNFTKIPETIGLIITMAFTQNAFFGGMVGVVVRGFTRAAFSNEAGLGSAAIAHAAAKTDEPVREGVVAMIGPFIDTIIVCLMTAMVVIITGAWNDPKIASEGGNLGITLTTKAFGSAIPWFPYVLTGCIGLFAYSTMISWCYYGERGWIYLLDHFGGTGLKTVFVFRVIFVIFVIVGAVNKFTDVLDFSDVMILSMAFPNIVGSIILAPKVLEKVKDYRERYKSGEIKPIN